MPTPPGLEIIVDGGGLPCVNLHAREGAARTWATNASANSSSDSNNSNSSRSGGGSTESGGHSIPLSQNVLHLGSLVVTVAVQMTHAGGKNSQSYDTSRGKRHVLGQTQPTVSVSETTNRFAQSALSFLHYWKWEQHA